MGWWLAASLSAALAAGRPAPSGEPFGWTRVRAPASASCAVLARALDRPELPYPYFTTYVLRAPAAGNANCARPTPVAKAPGPGCGPVRAAHPRSRPRARPRPDGLPPS